MTPEAKEIKRLHAVCREQDSEIEYLRKRIGELELDVELWRDRAASERADHEATIKQADEMMRNPDWVR